MRRLPLTLLVLLHASCTEQSPLPSAPVDGPLLTKQASGGRTYEVGFTTYLLHDASRGNRPIPVYVWYPVTPATITGASPEAQYPLEPFTNALPAATSSEFETYGIGRAWQEPAAAAGPFPLVLFSPGWGGAAYSDALYLGTALARRGFVVAGLTHWGDRAAPVPVPGEPFDHSSLSAWNRPRDMSFALTDLLTRNTTPGHLLHGTIAPGSVYASGWSWGGLASMVLAGGDDNGVCDFDYPDPKPPLACTSTAPDPRIRGIISLDGSGWAMHFYELARVQVPVLTMGQEWSAVGDWHAREHAAFSGHPNYRVDVNRAVHSSFSNWCEAWHVWKDKGIDPQPGWWDPAWGSVADFYSWLCQSPATEIMPSAEAHRLVTKYVLAFLTANQSILTPGHALTSEPDIEFFVTEKRNPNALTEDFPGYYAYFQHQPGRGTSKATVSFALKDPEGSRPTAGSLGRAKP